MLIHYKVRQENGISDTSLSCVMYVQWLSLSIKPHSAVNNVDS